MLFACFPWVSPTATHGPPRWGSKRRRAEPCPCGHARGRAYTIVVGATRCVALLLARVPAHQSRRGGRSRARHRLALTTTTIMPHPDHVTTQHENFGRGLTPPVPPSYQGIREKSQGFTTSPPHRHPRVSVLTVGLLLRRHERRTLLEAAPQDPPRRRRRYPLAGPCGSCGGLLW